MKPLTHAQKEAIAFVRQMQFLADAIERDSLPPGYRAVALTRLEGARAAAQPFIGGSATPTEQTRLVRDEITRSAECLRDKKGFPGVTIKGAADAAIRTITRDCPELRKPLTQQRALVEEAVSAISRRARASKKGEPTPAVNALEKLLSKLNLPMSKRSRSGRDKSGRVWPSLIGAPKPA